MTIVYFKIKLTQQTNSKLSKPELTTIQIGIIVLGCLGYCNDLYRFKSIIVTQYKKAALPSSIAGKKVS